MTALVVIGILVFLIVAHELGHFLAAKIFGVKVEEFGIGYPPRAFHIGTFNGTEYTLNWIPFGGFVRLFGESGEEKGRGAFASAPKYAQALILLAGVTANALTAWLLFAGALYVGIPRVIDEHEATGSVQLFINTVVPGSPADVAGAKEGDELVKITDANSKEAAVLTPSKVAAFVTARGGKELEMTFRRNDVEFTSIVRPAHAVVEESSNKPAVGVGLVLVTDESVGAFRALREGGMRTIDVFHQTAVDLWSLVRDSAAGEPSLQNVVGPVGLVNYVGNATKHGLGHVLALAGFISVNLAVINLIPIPALDGGRLVLVALEALLRRPPPNLIVQIFNIAGIALIVFLMVFVTYHDIARLFA